MSGEDQFECELGVDDSEKFGPLYWMVRPCEWYKQEYSDCKCTIVSHLQPFFFKFLDLLLLIFFLYFSSDTCPSTSVFHQWSH